MKYISATQWRDLTDGHLYAEGDEFPFDGREVPAERLDELVNGRNRAGLRLIEACEVQDEPEEVRKEYGFSSCREIPADARYDAIVLAVAHREFRQLDLAALKQPHTVVYDIKGILPREQVDGRL